MSAPRFFTAELADRLAAGCELALPETPAHHAAKVLRMRAGDALTLFTGAGGEFPAAIVHIDKRGVTVRIEAFAAIEREVPLATTLAQGVAANDAMEYAIRKAVELGAAAIQPVITQRSAPLPSGTRGEGRIARWRQIVVAACEQCGRNRLPVVSAPLSLAEWLTARDRTRAGIVLAPESALPLARVPAPRDGIDLLVGPEGGLAAAEIADAAHAGMIPVSLGPRILRTETAGVAALAAVNALWGDFR